MNVIVCVIDLIQDRYQGLVLQLFDIYCMRLMRS